MLKSMKQRGASEAMVWKARAYPYDWLVGRIDYWKQRIRFYGIKPGNVTIIEADFSPNSVALFLALALNQCILVPLTNAVETKKSELAAIAQGEFTIVIDANDHESVTTASGSSRHPYYDVLRQRGHAGLVLFSSGSTGESKAAVHDLNKLLKRYEKPGRSCRTIAFLLYDHIGGINTMFYTLANGGCLITVDRRDPVAVCRAIQIHNVDLLPTSPTFLNMLLLSEAHKSYDLSALNVITYGTEPMAKSTLDRIHEILPHVRLKQTYGLSELGILRSKSQSSTSLWLTVGGEGYETKIVDGTLWVRADSPMLGYLNAPNPFSEDGWLNTGDMVEIDGEFIRFLGRKSEIINVGGEKVHPIEVESVLESMNGVEEAVVLGERNAITGQMVTAKISLSSNENPSDFKKRMNDFCKDKLSRYKIPQKVVIVSDRFHSGRFKKMRKV
jgi:acyl-CoA synthetase (AMP-forming)/AMP-acid ligase II